MSLLDSIQGMLGGGDAGAAANQYFNQISPLMHQYYDPYVQGGLKDYGLLQGQFQNLMQNPAQFYNQMAATYKPSQQYQTEVSAATKAANQASAAGGMAGSPAEQQALGQQVSGFANKDMGDYMNRVMGVYNQGLQGLGGLNQMGYQASTGLAGNLANTLMNQANLAYSNMQNRNQQAGGMFGSLMGMFGGGGGAGGAGGGLF